MRRLATLFFLLGIPFAFLSCTTATTRDCPSGTHSEGDACVADEASFAIASALGLEDATIVTGHWFDPLAGVRLTTVGGADVTSHLEIVGNVDYGTPGIYALAYRLDYRGGTYATTRTITVADGIYDAPDGARPTGTNGIVALGEGSYRTGTDSGIAHPPAPSRIAANLLSAAVPSSSWWTTLLVGNQGSGNGLYTNPLRVAFSGRGMEITNPEDGFVQFWNNGGLQTIAQYSIALKDGYLLPSTLDSDYQTEVIGYGDAHVRVALRDPGSDVDAMVVTLVQGSPYVFVETADDTLDYVFDTIAVDDYRFYAPDGTPITASVYTGDALVVEMVHRHSGYVSYPPAGLGAAIYSDKFYLLNAPADTQFTFSTAGHPTGAKNHVGIVLGAGNAFTVCALNDLDEAPFYHENGNVFIQDTTISYAVDAGESKVATDYVYTPRRLAEGGSALIAMMPHQYRNADVVPTSYSYRTVRGTLEVLAASAFTTTLSFAGLLPSFTEPFDATYERDVAIGDLLTLDASIDAADSGGYINADGPYWNSKATHPLALGIVEARQLGATEFETSFVGKLEYILCDWLAADGVGDGKYLFYDRNWGSVYYANDDFGTASQLSDHSFTHGYLVFAAAVLAMADPAFVTAYGPMVDFLLDDYLYPVKDSADFAYLRHFDAFAGHTWAHGFGTFAEGNNLESSSEALNSWVAGYLWALATGDVARRDAAIYGFATELSAAKEYWFDYTGTNWDPVYGDEARVAGMVWGGKFDYATWFGANPTFIYGIQWLPFGEYLTNYALDDGERATLAGIYAAYLQAKGGTIDTWYAEMWAVQAIFDPIAAVAAFDAATIRAGEYPDDLSASYWMVHALASLGSRSTTVWMELHPRVAATVYEGEDGVRYAMVWNPAAEAQSIVFRDADGIVLETTVPARSFTRLTLA